MGKIVQFPALILAVACLIGLGGGLALDRVALSMSRWQPPVAEAVHDRAAPSGSHAGRVVRVIDGDSFRLDCCGPDFRLWGIDAPEWNQRGGSAATAALGALIAGRDLTCHERDIDRYGRIVGECALPDGGDLGERLLATGTVREYCHFSGNRYRTC